MAATIHVLRPYVASVTLRAMARERRIAAVEALTSGKSTRYQRWTRFRKQAEELEEEAQRAEHYEAECELTKRRAVADRLEKALEAAQEEGA